MSAIRSCTSWNDAIGLPNCVRSVAYATDASRQPCTIPTQPEATARRPLSRVPIAILKPCPTSPRRAASGTRTPCEEQLGRRLAAQPELVLDLAGLEAGGVGRHEERRHAARAVVAGAGEDEGDVGPRAVGDEELLAVDHPVRPVAGRARGEVAGVGPGAGLGEAEAAELRRGGELRQPLLLLLLGAVEEDRLADQPAADRHDPAQGGVGAAELLHRERVGHVVAADAAVLLGDGEAEEAELGHLRHDREVDGLVVVPLHPVRHGLALEEVAGEVAEGLLLLGEREVHQSASTRSWSVTRADSRRQVVVGVAEPLVEHLEVRGADADGVLRRHADAAVQLDRLLADVAPGAGDLQARPGRRRRRRRRGRRRRSSSSPSRPCCARARARRTCRRPGRSAPGRC